MYKLQTRGSHAIGIIIEDSNWISRARQAALEEVGLNEASVQFTRTAESEFLGRKYYEVEFSGDELNYECYIDAETWKVSGLNCRPIEI
jgi:uncharacterized membrane protein YkoI